MSDKTFTDLLNFMKKVFKLEGIPESFYETKKAIGALGSGYKKIYVCKNKFMLFWKDDKKLNKCKVCEESIWKPN